MKQKSIIISVKALDLKRIIPMVMLMILMININIQSVHSQTTLKYSNQGFRVGDKLVKQQVRYKNPGRTGKDVIWDFSNLKEISGGYTVNYNETTKKSKDTLFVSGTEHQTKYTYAYKSDSLLLLGFENPTSWMTFEKPQLLMKYPFTFGDSVYTGYMGKGSYNFTLLSETGKVYGGLYNWWVANDSRELIRGFRTATNHDFDTLCLVQGKGLIMQAGPVLMETGNAHWKMKPNPATNASGFTALPNGLRSGQAINVIPAGEFSEIGASANFWTSTVSKKDDCGLLWKIDDKTLIYPTDYYKNFGLGIRLVKNDN